MYEFMYYMYMFMYEFMHFFLQNLLNFFYLHICYMLFMLLFRALD